MPKAFQLISSARIFQLRSLLYVLIKFSMHASFSILAYMITVIFGEGGGGRITKLLSL